ncbi:MAG: endonuclease/exonuclease/phosphatase family protein [Myxococcales bacterium]|nr:endonuclease/exonuclease/phosphatase family protein [Myxococcales bacterium]
MHRITVLCAIAAAALIGCMEPPELTPRAPTPGVPHMTVMTYNVSASLARDPETIEAVGMADADIVCLQEVNSVWAESLQATYAERYPHMAFQGEHTGGLAILSKWPFEDLGVADGFEGWHPAWHVLVETPMGPVQVLQVHLRPPISRRGGVGSYFEIDEIHALEVETFSDRCLEDTPTLVVGDFNEAEDGGAITWLTARGYRSILPQFRPGQETWRYAKSLYGQTVDTLDHIVYDTQAFVPLNATVSYVGNSDHLPVVAMFEAPR